MAGITRVKVLFESQIPGRVEMTRKRLHQLVGFQSSWKKTQMERQGETVVPGN